MPLGCTLLLRRARGLIEETPLGNLLLRQAEFLDACRQESQRHVRAQQRQDEHFPETREAIDNNVRLCSTHRAQSTLIKGLIQI